MHWDSHANRLQLKAERFLANFQRVAGANGFTPYMHCLLAHVPNIVRRFGGLMKGCSQSVEKLNQRIQNTTATSNRHEDTLGAQVLSKEVMATMASDLGYCSLEPILNNPKRTGTNWTKSSRN